jgi:hypothetical protein
VIKVASSWIMTLRSAGTAPGETVVTLSVSGFTKFP